jgi:flagellar export protein FliJ
LEHRQKREDELKLRLAAAANARAQAEAELVDLVAAEAARREELSALLAGGRVEARRLLELGAFLEACSRAVVRQQGEVARRIAFEREERQRLTIAVQVRQALDRLRERHEERERAEALRKDAGLLEEIAGAAAALARLNRHCESTE